MMTFTEQILTVAILVLATASTRFVPFLIFRGKKTPSYIQYLSQVLPAAVFGMLVVYCLRNVHITAAPFGIPEAISVLVTALLHLWKRQMMISILGGTLTYMLIVQNIG